MNSDLCAKVCDDFAVLERKIHGHRLVYLDSAATSLTPRQVVLAMDQYYQHFPANIHRGIHTLAEEATAAYEQSRQKVADFVGAADPAEVVFVRNATEAINVVATCWAMTHIDHGDEIVLTELEHHANLVPWQRVARERGAVLKFIPVDDQGRLQIDRGIFTNRTKLLAFTQASNVLGTITPAAELITLAHAVGAVVLMDAAQSVPHMPVNMTELGVDFAAFSGHKLLGPTGVGVLYGRRQLLDEMPPFLVGGDMIRRVSYTDAEWHDVPHKFEAGTPNIAGVIGLGMAVDYVQKVGMVEVEAYVAELTMVAMQRLSQVEGVAVYGPSAGERVGVVAFNVEGVPAHDLASLVDRRGVAIRSGHHCAQPLVEKFGLSAMARASFYIYNTEDDVDRLIAAIEQSREIMRGGR